MKQIAKAILCIATITTSLFACGGCRDSGNASSGANSIKNAFDNADNEFSNEIEKLIALVEKTIEDETVSRDLLIKSTVLETHKLLELESIGFNENIKRRLR